MALGLLQEIKTTTRKVFHKGNLESVSGDGGVGGKGKSSWLIRTGHMHPVHLYQSSCGKGFGLS